MNKLSTLFLIALLFVTGCQPSESAINTAIAQTQAAMPTSTPASTATPAPITNLNFDSGIFKPEDLGLTSGKINPSARVDDKTITFSTNVSDEQSLELLSVNKRQYAGRVQIFLFKSPEDCITSFNNAKMYYSEEIEYANNWADNKKIGEDSFIYLSPYFAGVIYYQDSLLVNVHFKDNDEVSIFEMDFSTLISYSDALEARITNALNP